ncbi:hypothetical protein [Gelidibacter gilvus]|uniref:GNAT family N-acetyltransferase n=1 Tax=Gelidibacter gilvus TaxID=59602 RepID=A0A4Q0XEA8_9FLAO|nr:hypothetical protein [Gelidibacter gilvus]RXJ45414.1 hypothetical protein ESZ48_16485 [Gelidibacter gilvus]
MRKISKLFKFKLIDVYVYRMQCPEHFQYENFPYVVEKIKVSRNKTKYYIANENLTIHESYLYQRTFLLRLLKISGPVIGDCYTNIKYRGQSIYPFVINYIANDVIEATKKDVFIIVNSNNFSSIKGIEKAGFKKYAEIKAKRWLVWYHRKHIILMK